MEKRSFQRPYIDLHAERDLGITGIDHTFRTWKDPSRPVVFALIDMVGMSKERLDKLSEQEKQLIDMEFWSGVSKVFIDCDIAGLDFSTPELAKASFENPDVSWDMLYAVLLGYLNRLIEENESVKNAIARLAAISHTGRANDNKDEK
jgi:hypothetical protein